MIGVEDVPDRFKVRLRSGVPAGKVDFVGEIDNSIVSNVADKNAVTDAGPSCTMALAVAHNVEEAARG
ncbi:hypothetical protein D3C87_2018850 [compost metagenome]